jgi:hypothetical protein
VSCNSCSSSNQLDKLSCYSDPKWFVKERFPTSRRSRESEPLTSYNSNRIATVICCWLFVFCTKNLREEEPLRRPSVTVPKNSVNQVRLPGSRKTYSRQNLIRVYRCLQLQMNSLSIPPFLSFKGGLALCFNSSLAEVAELKVPACYRQEVKTRAVRFWLLLSRD